MQQSLVLCRDSVMQHGISTAWTITLAVCAGAKFVIKIYNVVILKKIVTNIISVHGTAAIIFNVLIQYVCILKLYYLYYDMVGWVYVYRNTFKTIMYAISKALKKVLVARCRRWYS